MMRVAIWIFRFLVFFMLLGFALKNNQVTAVKFFFGKEWDVSLMFIILVSFSIGAMLGVSATITSLLRKQRTIWQLKRRMTQVD